MRTGSAPLPQTAVHVKYLEYYKVLKMIEVVLNDRLGKKVRVKCNEDDTIGDLKKLVAAQTGTRPDKIRMWVSVPS